MIFKKRLHFIIAKAKLLKHMGEFEKSSDQMEEARSLDLADRYLNTLSVKYYLRASKIEDARKILSIFSKLEPEPVPYSNNIIDMQVIWYEQEEALSFLRKGEVEKALHKLNLIDKHFAEFIEDQFPFHIHSYCYNKMTLIAYYKFIKFEDSIYKQKFYIKAAKSLIRCYLEIYDYPDKYVVKDTSLGVKQPNTTSTTAKKGRGRGRPVGNKAKNTPQPEKEEEKKKKTVEDEDIEKLKSVNKKPLDHAMVYLERLLQFSNDFESNELAFEVFMRRKKFLLVVKSLYKLLKINPKNSNIKQLFERLIKEVSNPETQEKNEHRSKRCYFK